MSRRDRNAFGALIGTNMYVPAMGYSAGMVDGQPYPYSLGTPAAVSANAIVTAGTGNATAGTKTTLTTPYTVDSRYGRTLRVTPSSDPGNSGAIDIFGVDYLGQPMAERFTGASGSTAILYGKKAFYRVDYWKVVTATTNAITWAVGTGWRFGLPYRGNVQWAKEAGVYVPLYSRDFIQTLDIAGAAVAGGPSGGWLIAPTPGFVNSIAATANMPAGSTNDPAVTVELGGTAITGLTVTIDTSAAATGAKVTDAPTTVGYSANNRFRPGDLIEVVLSDADSSGQVRVEATLTPTQFTFWDFTDPQTLTTGDPRGTYESIMTPDGAGEIIVGLVGDTSLNSSSHGGLHGMPHVIA
jgi:hypothetical protein